MSRWAPVAKERNRAALEITLRAATRPQCWTHNVHQDTDQYHHHAYTANPHHPPKLPTPTPPYRRLIAARTVIPAQHTLHTLLLSTPPSLAQHKTQSEPLTHPPETPSCFNRLKKKSRYPSAGNQFHHRSPGPRRTRRIRGYLRSEQTRGLSRRKEGVGW